MIGIYLALVVGAGLLTLFITHFADYDIKLPRFMRSKQKEEPTPDIDRPKIIAVCRRCSNCKFDPELGLVCGLTGKRGDFQDECERFYLDDAYVVKKQVVEHVKEYEPQCIKKMTKHDLQSILFHAGYTVTEEYEPETGKYITYFSVAEHIFSLFYNGTSLIINYRCAVETDADIARAIANKLMDDMIAIKIYVENISEDSRVGVRFAIETYMYYADECRVQFTEYIHLLRVAAYHFYEVLNEYGSDENKRRRNIYNREFFRFSDLVDAVTDGKCGDGAFTDEEWLREGLRRDCDEEYKSAWDEFKILQATKYGNYKLIVYRFPEPKVMPEALYGAVLLDTTTHKADYYTLEYSANGKWVLGSTSRGKHSNYGEVDTPDLEQFIAWIFNSNKQLCYYTDMNNHETQKVN